MISDKPKPITTTAAYTWPAVTRDETTTAKGVTRHKLGYNLQRARERALLTQKMAGERTGLGRSMIKAIERGKRRSIDPGMLQTIADCYGVSVSEFFRE